MQSYCADSRVLRWRICECQRAEQKNEETLSAPTAHPREPQGWVGPVQLATPATHQERVCPGKSLAWSCFVSTSGGDGCQIVAFLLLNLTHRNSGQGCPCFPMCLRLRRPAFLPAHHSEVVCPVLRFYCRASYRLASVSVIICWGWRLVPKSEILLPKTLSSGLGVSGF